MRNLLLALGIVFAVFVIAACGNQDPDASPRTQPVEDTTTEPTDGTQVSQAPWIIRGEGPGDPGRVALSAGTRRFRIMVWGGSCHPQAPPTFDHVEIQESTSVVVVSAFLRQEEFRGGSCLGVGYNVPGTVELDMPLGSRSIVDNAKTGDNPPPILRWPGTSVVECFEREKRNIRDPLARDARPAETVAELVEGINSRAYGSPEFDRVCLL